VRRLVPALALILVAAAAPARAEDPAPASPPPAPRGSPPGPFGPPRKPAVPDPEPWLSITGAGLEGISRDGSVVAIRMQRDGVSQLFRTSPAGGWPHRLTFRRDNPDFVAVAPDGRRAIVGWDQDGDEDYGLYVVDLLQACAERPLRVLPRVKMEDVVWSREGDRIWFRDNADGAADFHIRELVVDATTPSVRTVLAKPGSWGTVDACPGGARLLVALARGNYDVSLYLLDVRTGDLREIDPAPAGTTRAPGPARFLGSGEEVLFVSDRDGEWRRPYLWRVADGSVRPLVAGDDGKRGPDVEDVEPTRDGRAVYMTVNDGGRGRVVAVEVATGKPLPAPDVGDALASGLAIDDSGRLFFTLARSDGPGSVVRWDPGTTAVVPLTFPDLAGVPPTDLPLPPRLVEVPTFDGKSVPAWLWLPRGREPKGLPFVVSFHGGPEGQDRPSFAPDRGYLLAQGYGILAPNVRGSTGYGRAWRDMDNYKARLDSVRDGKACADWLVKEGLATPGRVAAMGGSYGGYMVLAELTEFPDAFAAGIDVVGIANFETFLERTADYRRALREAEYGPLTDREFLRSISPIHKVDRITAALLLGHGERDPRVPVGEARQMQAALEARGRPVQAVYFKDEGHGFAKKPNRRVWLRTVAEFLKERIGGP
jgi:dipeptidyl aminopeptidase/acylaminoacyl peptidase